MTNKQSASELKRTAAMLAAIGTVVLWASAFVGIRLALRTVGPLELAACRQLTASLTLGLVTLGLMAPGHTRPNVGRGGLVGLGIAGLLGFTGYNVALNMGQTAVSATAASFIVNTVPVLTAILAGIFLGERMNLTAWASSGISLAGVAIIIFGRGSAGGMDWNAAALLVFVVALCQAGYFILQRKYVGKHGVIVAVTLATWTGTLPLLAFAPSAFNKLAAAPIFDVGVIVYLGLFPSALGYVLWSFALKHIPASRAANLLYLVPLITIVGEGFSFHTLPSLSTLLGGAIAVGGVILANAHRS